MVRCGMLVAATLIVASTGCAGPPTAPAASASTASPPWSAPRDASANIDSSGLRRNRLDARENPHIVRVEVVVDNQSVIVPRYIGVDRVRAVQAPAHTHDESGDVWLEGEGTDDVTLESFFVLWGVRFDAACLGSACGSVQISADGLSASPSVRLRSATTIRVEARSGK